MAKDYFEERRFWNANLDEHLWLPLLEADPTFLRFGDIHAKLLRSFTLGTDKVDVGEHSFLPVRVPSDSMSSLFDQ